MRTLLFAAGVLGCLFTSFESGLAQAQTVTTTVGKPNDHGCACGPDCPCGPDCCCGDDTSTVALRFRIGPRGTVRFRGRIPPWLWWSLQRRVYAYRPQPYFYGSPALYGGGFGGGYGYGFRYGGGNAFCPWCR